MDLDQALNDATEASIDPSTIQAKSDQDKIRLAANLNRKGVSQKEIARLFGVTPRTIYDWLRKDMEHVVMEFEEKTALDLIVEHLADLSAYEKLCMFEASHFGQDHLEFNPETMKAVRGAVTTKELEVKIKFIDLAGKFRQAQLNLLTQTGVIPKVPDRIYSTVKDNKTETGEAVGSASGSTKADMEVSVLQKLRCQTNLE